MESEISRAFKTAAAAVVWTRTMRSMAFLAESEEHLERAAYVLAERIRKALIDEGATEIEAAAMVEVAIRVSLDEPGFAEAIASEFPDRGEEPC